MIRSSIIILDEAMCAAQGYLAAVGLNQFAGTQYNPQTAAIGYAGVALLDRLIYQISSRVIPGTTGFLGPIPIGSKNIVSYGLALFTTAKVMEAAGLILSVPRAVSLLGLVSGIALVAGALFQAVRQVPLKEHLASKSFANRIYVLPDGDKELKIRIICNPEEKTITFSPGGSGKVSSSNKYILFSNNNISKACLQALNLGDSVSVITSKINNVLPLDYSANLTVS